MFLDRIYIHARYCFRCCFVLGISLEIITENGSSIRQDKNKVVHRDKLIDINLLSFAGSLIFSYDSDGVNIYRLSYFYFFFLVC